MNTYFRMNAVMKVLTVAIIGYFVFELLFGIVTGNFLMNGGESGSGSHHPASGSEAAKYSFDITINALLLLFVKLLIVLFFVLLIAGIVKWMREIWNEEGHKELKSPGISKEISSILIVTGAALGILVLLSIAVGFTNGGESEYGMIMTNSNLYYGNGYFIKRTGIMEAFVNVLMYITAILLGIEVFTYLMRKGSK